MKIVSLCKHLALACTLLVPTPARAWHDATHMAVAKAAGLDNLAYLAVGPDMAKEKAGDREAKNHYHNTPKGVEITTAMVLAQVGDYNRPNDADGHLHGAIIAAVNDFLRKNSANKYALYSIGYAAHYLGDLSMPFHNIAYDDFNRAHHGANDATVEASGPTGEATDAKVARLAGEIQRRMRDLPPLRLPNDGSGLTQELAAEIAELANRSAALGYAMRDEQPQRTRMTEEEAYGQLAWSARLLQAVRLATMQ
ncbi:MAG: hypothetical protein ACOY3Z_09750 [Thermodesulfobacteriota bacterium]